MQVNKLPTFNKLVADIEVTKAIKDNAVSSELYSITHEPRHYIQIHEGHFVTPTDINWQEYTDEKYERAINK